MEGTARASASAEWSWSPNLPLLVPPFPVAGEPWIWTPVAAPAGARAGTSYLLCGPPSGSGAGCRSVYVTATGALAPARPLYDAPLFLPTTELALRKGSGESAGPDELVLAWSDAGDDRALLWSVAGGSFVLGALLAFMLASWARRRPRRSRGADQEQGGGEEPLTQLPIEETAEATAGEPTAARQAPAAAAAKPRGAAPPHREEAPAGGGEIATGSAVVATEGPSGPSAGDGGRPSQAAAGLEEPMAPLARAYWRDKRPGLSRLREKVRESDLDLFEWRRFDDVLRVPAASAVALEFVPWSRGSTGPIFLGRSTGDSLLLLPTSSNAFGSDQGLSALRSLFELRPDPTRKTFEFRDVVRPCRVRPEGSRYRLVEKGIVITDAENRGAEGATASISRGASRFPPTVDRPASDPPASSVEQIRRIEKFIQRELSQQTQSLLNGLRDSTGGARRGVTLDGDSLERIRGVVSEVFASSLRQSQAAAHAPVGESRSTNASSRGARRSDRQHESAAPSELPFSPAEPQPTVLRPTAGDSSPLRTSWMEAILQRATCTPPFGKKRYVADLHQLGSTLRQAAPAPSWSVALFQVRLGEGGRLGLDPVELSKDARGDLQLFGADGGSLPEYLWWEVMLGLSSERGSAGRLALLFPWSRHETGAPHLARELFAGAATRGLPDVVRCTAPAELAATGEEKVYTIIRKLSIAPVEGG